MTPSHVAVAMAAATQASAAVGVIMARVHLPVL